MYLNLFNLGHPDKRIGTIQLCVSKQTHSMQNSLTYTLLNTSPQYYAI